MAGILLAGMLALPSAEAAPKVAHIHYAEAISLPGLPNLASAGRLKPESVQTSFEAYGRRFELQLESNERILRGLSSANRNALPAHALYAGVVLGLPGSWVRLARLKDGVRGLVFDGTELYVVAPADTVAGELDAAMPGVTAGSTLIFRAADGESGLGPDFCKVLTPGTGAKASGGPGQPPDYKAVFAELQSFAPEIAAALPTKELDLALVADTQFAAQFANPTGEMLARLNNVDGIFSAQVGVKVVSGYMQVLTTSSGMTSTAPETLLDQFESYRKVTPEAASRGLAHLMTSRELDGPTVGIAYMSTLCAPQFAVSLSQTYQDTYFSSLVAAHEIGHNFGAPHDGVAGACSTMPQVFLMSPTINGSSTFSSCSLSQMSPVVSGASCLTAAKYVDVAVDIPAATYDAYSLQDLHIPVNVTSRGARSADSVGLNLNPGANLLIKGATVAGGSCSANATGVSCQLGMMAAGETRRVDVVVTSSTVGSTNMRAGVSVVGDVDASNDNVSATINFATPADGSVVISPRGVTGYVRQPLPFSVTVSNAGPLTLQDATLYLPIPGSITMNSAFGTGANCSQQTTQIRCAIGSLPAGESRQIDFTVTALSPIRMDMTPVLQSSNDSVSGNNYMGATLTVLPLVELVLDEVTDPGVIPLGNTVTQSFTLRSVGPQPVNGASFQLATGPGIAIDGIAGPGAVCGPTDAVTYRCTYASPIESGGSRQLDATLRGTATGYPYATASIAAPDSQHLLGPQMDAISLHYLVQALVDVWLTATSQVVGFDHRTSLITYQLISLGATPPPNTRFTLTLPASVSATAAQPSSGSCSIASGTVSCAIGTMANGSSATVQIGLQSATPGTYTLVAQGTADGDPDANNSTTSTSFMVLPNIDVSVAAMPDPQHLRQGLTVDYVITLAAASQPATGVNANVSVTPGATILAATPTQGNCSLSGSVAACTLGTIPANATATITVRLRGDSLGDAIVIASATASGDVDPTNDSRNGHVTVEARGDVAVLPPDATPAATVGTTFTLPDIVIQAVAPTDDVRATVTIPSAFSILSATAGSAPCSVDAGVVGCSFGTLTAGAQRAIILQVRPNQAGTFSVTIQASAADDADTSNNSRSLQVAVSKGASGGGSSGGGSGGGGTLDLASLLLLMLCAPLLAGRPRKSAH